jgi:Protein of unknown function (DUF2975)
MSAPVPRKATRLARIAEVIVLVAFGGLVLFAAYLLSHREALIGVLSQGIDEPITTPPDWALALATVVFSVPAILFCFGMWHVRRLFRLLAAGTFADAALGHALRSLGWIAIAGGIFSIIGQTLIAALMTVANPPGHKVLLIAISSGQIGSLIMGLLFFMFTHVFAEVARIDADNKSIV